MSEVAPRIAVVVFPGSNDDRDAAWALVGARRRADSPLARRRGAPAGRRRRPPGRLLLRRLPALRSHRPLLAGHARSHRVRGGRRARPRDLQRLPDPLRGRPPPRRPPSERVARVRVPRRRHPRRAHGHAVHLPLRGGPGARIPVKHGEGCCAAGPRRHEPTARSHSGTRPARIRTVRSGTSRASSTGTGTFWA